MSVSVPALDVAQARLTAPTIGPADYAALLQTDVSIVYRAIHAGDVPTIKLGRRFRIPSAWVREQLRMQP